MTRTLGTRSRGRRLATAVVGAVAGIVLLVLTAGCGSSSSVAQDPSSGPASDPAGRTSVTPGPIEGAVVLPLISATAVGGHGGTVATPIRSERDVARFAAQFRGPFMTARIQHAVADELAADERDVVAQVVAIGCNRPPGVDVIRNADGSVSLAPREVASPLPECLASVTTVAIALLPRT